MRMLKSNQINIKKPADDGAGGGQDTSLRDPAFTLLFIILHKLKSQTARLTLLIQQIQTKQIPIDYLNFENKIKSISNSNSPTILYQGLNLSIVIDLDENYITFNNFLLR